MTLRVSCSNEAQFSEERLTYLAYSHRPGLVQGLPDSNPSCPSYRNRYHHRADPGVETILVPMADGGQGSVDAVLRSTKGQRRTISVMGPLGTPVQGVLALLDEGKTALFEMASASGLELVPLAERNPMRTTTFGTGELLCAAVDRGADRVIIGIGEARRTMVARGRPKRSALPYSIKKGTPSDSAEAIFITSIESMPRISILD